jgi:hypothetical protein
MKTIVEYYDPETDKKETKEIIDYQIIDNRLQFTPKRGNIIKSVVIDNATFSIYGRETYTTIITTGFQYITSSGGYWKTETRITISA